MAKRITSSAVNWSFIIETLPKKDGKKVLPLKIQSEKYLREIASRPAELPKIDWSFYKTRIAASGMVDSFQKSYEALKIPYPSDQGELSQTETSNKKMNDLAKSNSEKILVYIEENKKKLQELEGVMKYSAMTLEELFLARPDWKIDADNPKFWPPNLPDDEEAEDEHKS